MSTTQFFIRQIFPERPGPSGLALVLIIYVLYGIVHALISRMAGPALALDDVKLNIVTQSLQAGYMGRNPPLFEWLLILVQQVTGPTLASFVLVKYFWLTLIGGFSYLTMREATNDRNWAVLSATSILLIYQIGYNYHQAFTHTTALIAMVAFFWWTLIRLRRKSGIFDFALLGFALGLGVLAKYSFLAAALVVFICVLRLSDWRKALIRPGALVALLIAGIIVLPHLAWVLNENRALSIEIVSSLQGQAVPYWSRVGEGVPEAVWAIISYGLPFLPILLWAFGRRVITLTASGPVANLARDATILGAGFLLLAVFLLGMSGMQERYAIAFLFPFTFWAMINLHKMHHTRGEIARFVAASVAVAFIIFAIRIVAVVSPGAPFCSKCRQFIPYAPLAEAIGDAGFSQGTLVGFEDHTAGNLRRLFPAARVLSSHLQTYTPPATPAQEDKDADCWFIWSEDLGPPPPQHIVASIDPDTVKYVDAVWPKKMRGKIRTTSWTIAPMNHSPALVSELCRIH